MKNQKLELTFGVIFLVIHLIMLGMLKQVNANIAYWIILDLCLIASIFLISRFAWVKFKRRLE